MKLQEFISAFYNNSINNEQFIELIKPLLHKDVECITENLIESYLIDDYGSCERDKCAIAEQFIELIKPLLHEDVECITENLIEMYTAIKNGEDLSRFDF